MLERMEEVKESLKNTYSTSHIKADGQVVGINFEIVPVFENWDGSFTYPDTNNGGSWEKTNPRKKIEEMDLYNSLTNGNLKRLCKMLRELRK